MLGKRAHPADIIKQLEYSGQVAGGAIGVMPWGIQLYFTSKGRKIKSTRYTYFFDMQAKRAKANILLYYYAWGAHYIAFRWNGRAYLFYNINSYSNIYLPTTVKGSLTQWLKQNKAIAPLLISIY